MQLNEALTSIKGIGPGRAERFAALGLFSVRDLIYFSPRDYLDYSVAKRIADIQHGEYAAVCVKFIGTAKSFRTKNGLTITSVSIGDDSGNMQATWFNQPYIGRSIPREAGGYILGRMDRQQGAKFINAVFVDELPGILPVYPLARRLNQNIIHNAVKTALNACVGDVPETLDSDMRNRFKLAPIDFSIRNLHFPADMNALYAARRRLSFEDALIFTIVLEIMRSGRSAANGIAFKTENIIDEFLPKLPFLPTEAQLKVMGEISTDMASSIPMNRLIQGDVGSGKTVLALYAMFAAMKNGYQSVLMAPTEILAEQHYKQLKGIFGERCALIVGGMSKRQSDAILEGIRSGDIIAITGTHALIEGKVKFNRLGLVITDEQHRFGVRQRALLGHKGEEPNARDAAETCVVPDTLIMSATPIPRTLSLILYGDLDISIVDGMPPGRKPVITQYVPKSKRVSMYKYIENCIKEQGIQAYVVCPMIEDNDEISDALSAESVYDELKNNLCVRLGLMHGRLKNAQKDEMMTAFRAHEIDLLVSTTVIEVGVDVPNACIMVIESAERFGLAQLHQLRGRVGRGEKESHCFLLSSSQTQTVKERLKTLVSTNDGFKIAQKDLETRGPGEFLGIRQHGISEFASASLAINIETLTEARNAAIEIIKNPTEKNANLIRLAKEKYHNVVSNIVIN